MNLCRFESDLIRVRLVGRVSHGLVVGTLFISVAFLDHGGGNV